MPNPDTLPCPHPRIARRSFGFIALLTLAGCTPAARLNLASSTGGNAALFAQFRAYDGHTGQPLSFREVAGRCAAADVVLFGEEHSDSVCNQFEAQLLSAMAAQPRPTCLAMEFFEADTQAALDEYRVGRLDEPAFRKTARQGRAYVLAHRPLIEMCRAACIPVIAANAPRRLVSEYRKSDLDYADFRAGLDPADRQWLPPNNEYLTGDYHDRFIETMTQHEEPPRPQTAPAESPNVPAPPPGMPAMPPGAAMPPSMPPAPLTVRPVQPPKQAPATAPAADPLALAAELAASANRLAEAATEISRILEQYAASSQPSTPPGMPIPPPGKPATMPGAEPPAGGDTMPPLPADPEAFYRAQLLWDETMAASVAAARDCDPQRRVLLIVGGFHIIHDGGTAQKLRHRRPEDRILTVAYCGTTDPCLAFDPDDRGAGDIIIYGIQPPPESKTGKPASMPVMTRPATATD